MGCYGTPPACELCGLAICSPPPVRTLWVGFTGDPKTLLRGRKRGSHCLLWTRTLQAHTVPVLTREGTNETRLRGLTLGQRENTQGRLGPASRSYHGREDDSETHASPPPLGTRQSLLARRPPPQGQRAVLGRRPHPPARGRPSPLGAQGQVELANGLQELPLQHLVVHSAGQRELELVVDDAAGLVGHNRAVEVAEPLDGEQLAWWETEGEALSGSAAAFEGLRPLRRARLCELGSLHVGTGWVSGSRSHSRPAAVTGPGRARHRCSRDSAGHWRTPRLGGPDWAPLMDRDMFLLHKAPPRQTGAACEHAQLLSRVRLFAAPTRQTGKLSPKLEQKTCGGDGIQIRLLHSTVDAPP